MAPGLLVFIAVTAFSGPLVRRPLVRSLLLWLRQPTGGPAPGFVLYEDLGAAAYSSRNPTAPGCAYASSSYPA
jgi:hypothetical protein